MLDMEGAAIAANRFGLGARPGELRVIAADPRGWLKAQLTPESTPPAEVASLPHTAEAAAAFYNWVASIGIAPGVNLSDASVKAQPVAASGMAGAEQGKLSVEQSYIHTLGPPYAAAVGARFRLGVTTERPFFERLVRFWSNHFTVSAAKPEIIALAPVYERDVIRPHLCGGFSDMLLASCRHPGMLIYLDNFLSIGPNSPLAHNPQLLPPYLRERMKGLNENLGREILELHTLGVRTVYTQDDVTSLARIITGWTVRGPNDARDNDNRFHYVDFAHEPGAHSLLGKRYAPNREGQGIEALRDLALHPSTATHLATKLARHFISDQPPPESVARIARSYLDSAGDLRTTTLAVIDDAAAWTPRLSKLKTPEDFVVSSLRAVGAPAPSGRKLIALMERMGQRPYGAPGPDGWSDVEDGWTGADAIWKRIEWASALGAGAASATMDPAAVADSALGPLLSAPTLQAIRAADSPAQGLALLLASPDFQRR